MKNEKIQTNNGIYEYEEVEFILGSKIIDREIAKDNLLTLKKCFDRYSLSFGLIYGTLLGAIRENNFIAHDEDTDIFILDEDREKLLDILFELRKLGFETGRYNEELLSIIKNGEYIDIYFFIKKSSKIRECGGYIIEAKTLENLQDYDFLGKKFKVPKDPKKLLISLYGKNWQIPDKNSKPINYGSYLRVKNFIKNNFGNLFNMISWIKQKLNV